MLCPVCLSEFSVFRVNGGDIDNIESWRDCLHWYSRVLRIRYGHRRPSRLPVIGSQEQIGVVNHVPVPAEHAGSGILATDVRCDISLPHEPVVTVLVFPRPLGCLPVKGTGDL